MNQQQPPSSLSSTTSSNITTNTTFASSASILKMIEHTDKKEGEDNEGEKPVSSSSYPLVDPSIYEEKIGEEEEAQALRRWRQLKLVVSVL